MRSEERASQQEIESSKQGGRLLSSAASWALPYAKVAAGSAVLSRISPFLNDLIPSELAMKGLSKIDPRLGKFFKGILSSGHTADEGLQYLRKELTPESTKNQPVKMQSPKDINVANESMNQGVDKFQAQRQHAKNMSSKPPQEQIKQSVLPQGGGSSLDIISSQSPELGQFLDKQLQQGRTPEVAAAMAKQVRAFESPIRKIERMAKRNFVDIFSESHQGQATQGQQEPQQPQIGVSDKLMQALKMAQQARQRRQK